MTTEKIVVWKSTMVGGGPVCGKRGLPLPCNGRPGRWHDTEGDPILCQRGVHGCRTLRDALCGGWLHGWLWVAELRGPFAEEPGSKVAGRSGRLLFRVENWNEQTYRLFAADCAEAVGHLHPIVEPTIRVVRRYAFGLETPAALAAAMAAARDAAWAAPIGSGARSAAWTTCLAASSEACCSISAAHSAAESAWDATRDAQALRLYDYVRGVVDLDAIRRSVS